MKRSFYWSFDGNWGALPGDRSNCHSTKVFHNYCTVVLQRFK
ncbi:hypothetical protein PN466_13815 [Roseofilum reptotaenium CS-1145]|nr:hypothetical protein [Roseofilum reptotaenium CS-1145]